MLPIISNSGKSNHEDDGTWSLDITNV